MVSNESLVALHGLREASSRAYRVAEMSIEIRRTAMYSEDECALAKCSISWNFCAVNYFTLS